ncbi:MAG: hypothetical protein MSC31_05605 [Solirubrobacteraceae bacterium MAG38_C4-C5]|nr:hypothetical protein [Candidatus Siliceabacter maunaloa]
MTEDFTVRRAGQPEEPRGPVRLVALVEAGSAPFDDVRQCKDRTILTGAPSRCQRTPNRVPAMRESS